MRWQERIEVDKGVGVEIGGIELGVLELGALSQCLAFVCRTDRSESILPALGFFQETFVADLLDVAGRQIDLDRKAVVQLEQFRRIQCCTRIVFGQCLLGGAERSRPCRHRCSSGFCQAVQVENQIGTRRNVLADFVDDKDDVLFARTIANDVEHFLNTVGFESHNLRRLAA